MKDKKTIELLEKMLIILKVLDDCGIGQKEREQSLLSLHQELTAHYSNNKVILNDLKDRLESIAKEKKALRDYHKEIAISICNFLLESEKKTFHSPYQRASA